MQIPDFFAAGGIVAWPLLILSLSAIALTAERAIFWFRISRRQQRVIRDTLRRYLEEPDWVMQNLRRNIDLPIARIFLEALSLEEADPEDFRLALESTAQAELPTLSRFDTAFETIVAVAPLLGLLGTILGLIRSFSFLDLGNAGGSNAVGVTSGLSEALVSTVMGLVVAIATLLFTNLFRSLYTRQLALIQEYGGQLELLYRRRYKLQRKTYASL